MRPFVTAIGLLLCVVAAVQCSAHVDREHLLGRHDGHEPGIPQDADDSSLLGRRDGHELFDKDGDSEDSSNDEVEGPEFVPDGGQRLIRCKRPLCEMICLHGFETDESGCQVCRCRQRPLLGRPDGHEKCVGRPVCRMYCEMGFQTGADGCPVCRCLRNPCEGIKCATGSVCQPQRCEDQHFCTKLSAKCVAGHSRLPCAEPMCANACPNGYKKNAAGCMTCQCVETPAERMCGSAHCEEGQVCRNKSIGALPAVPSCTVKTLCESKKDKPVGFGEVLPECEADGSFKPLQCNNEHGECWCVDGRGEEILGTRTSEQKPNCVRNITLSMHVHMVLVVRHDVDIRGHLNTLNATIVDHVSSWLLIEKHYIRITKAEVEDKGSDDYNEKSEAPRLFIVEFVVIHDGSSDLPSAGNYMKQRMHHGHCHIKLADGSTLEPDADTVKMHHKFAYEPTSTKSGALQSRRAVRLGICITSGLLFILLIASLAAAISRRRRLRIVQFKHHKLVNPVLSEKNLLQSESGYVKTPEVVTAVPVAKEKEPIA